MCYVAYKYDKEGSTPRIANEDIECVKMLERNLRNGCTYAPYQSTLYHKTKDKKCTKTAKINPVVGYLTGTHLIEAIVINEGIHAYRSNSLSLNNMKSLYTFYPIRIFCKAVIPKGTTYYMNEKGEIVTEKLIVYRECTKY